MAKNDGIKKSNKERALERMRTSDPNRNYEDEEELFGKVNDDYDKYVSDLAEANKNNEEVNEMLSKDPRSSAFLSAWRRGENPLMAFIGEYTDDIVADMQNPENRAKIEEASKKYLERLAKSKELDEEYEKNMKESREVYKQMLDDGAYSQGQIDKALDKLENVANEFMVGKVSKETLEAMIKSNDYDADVATANSEGEIRGRNAQIMKGRKLAAKGDGLPQGGAGGGTAKVGDRGENEAQLGALRRYGRGRSSIWDD